MPNFVYRFIHFEFERDVRTFKPVVFDITTTHAEILGKHSAGLTEQESSCLRHKYGPCELRVPRKGACRLLVDEVLNPFYIF